MAGGEQIGVGGIVVTLILICSPFLAAWLFWKLNQRKKSEAYALNSAKREGLQRAVAERENEELKQRVEVLAGFKQLAEDEATLRKQLENELVELKLRLSELDQYQGVVDVQRAMSDLTEVAYANIRRAQAQAREAFAAEKASMAAAREAADRDIRADRAAGVADRQQANKFVQETQAQCLKVLKTAHAEAELVTRAAHDHAQELAGEALTMRDRAREFEIVAAAMKGIIEGYGDAYVVPVHSALDDLALEFGHDEAGQLLAVARARSRSLVTEGKAGLCDYVEPGRRDAAVRFVVEAFNGKADSILSRLKSSNEGALAQELRDAFHLVNYSGAPFRQARVTDAYFQSRLDELRWGSRVQVLRERARDEQRLLREQIKEEQRAVREREKAIKDAEKDRATLESAMVRARAQVAAASEAQRARYELKLKQLEDQLLEAEARGRRAVSMAQQTKAGHVYVISNVGSFGESVFKIGMTRRLDPLDRIRELGDASVPFEFDVHGMIYSDDAPALERALHVKCLNQQMNKVNARKEFFRVSLLDIQRHVEELGLQAVWTVVAAATSYRETLRLEARMRENPELAKLWTERQIAFELSDEAAENQLEQYQSPGVAAVTSVG